MVLKFVDKIGFYDYLLFGCTKVNKLLNQKEKIVMIGNSNIPFESLSSFHFKSHQVLQVSYWDHTFCCESTLINMNFLLKNKKIQQINPYFNKIVGHFTLERHWLAQVIKYYSIIGISEVPKHSPCLFGCCRKNKRIKPC